VPHKMLVTSAIVNTMAKHREIWIKSRQRMDQQIHETKETFVMKSTTVPEAA
jgi:hypothetical protein